MTFVAVMAGSVVMFLLFRSNVLAAPGLPRCAQRDAHVLGRDLEGTFLLDRCRRASSLFPSSTLVPVALPGLSWIVMAMIGHDSMMGKRAIETFNRYSYIMPRRK